MTQVLINDVAILKSPLFQDNRGSFESTWESHQLLPSGRQFIPSSVNFSYNSKKNTLRGLHLQKSPYQQAKIVTCVSGVLWDVVVDLRQDSETFKMWQNFVLKAESGCSIFIPKGCAHGFVTMENNTTVAYIIEGEYAPDQSISLNWQDQSIGISWPVINPIISEKDKLAPMLGEI